MMLNVDGISIYTRIYVTTDSDQMGQIYLGQEELRVRRIGYRCHDGARCHDAHRVRGRCDFTSASHQWEESWSDRTTGYGSSCKRDANKDLGKDGLHEGRSNFNESQTSGRQARINLRGQKESNNGPLHGRTRSLNELPGG